MSPHGCPEWRGDLAMRALGGAAAETDDRLDAHLAGCAACQAELDELRAAAEALSLAEVDHIEPAGTPFGGVTPGVRPGISPEYAGPPALADRIVERVAAERAAARRHRRRVAVAGGVAAAVVVSVAVLASTLGGNGSPGRVEFAGTAGATGSAVLTAQPWGTEVTLDVSGLDQGEVYWLWLTDDGGERVVAGTLTGTGGPARAVLASALATEDARRIWMTDEADRVVLDADIAAGSLPGR